MEITLYRLYRNRAEITVLIAEALSGMFLVPS